MQEKFPNVSLLKDLSGAYKVVIQNGNVTQNNIYALQLRNSQTDTYVICGSRATGIFNKTPALILHGDKTKGYNAGGHTQTWEYANKPESWFVGTKPNNANWNTQIARVKFPSSGTTHIYYNTDMPRLSYLNRAGKEFGINYLGKNMKRVEAAVSPNYVYMLIASVDTTGTGYFSIYNLAEVNNFLDKAANNPKPIPDVPIMDLSCQSAFKIDNFVNILGNLQHDPKGGSIQGYDIDDNLNIYISSEKSPKQGNLKQLPRKIVKIPWGITDTAQWEFADLDSENMDILGYISEFESIQVIDANTLYLTVSYHKKAKDFETGKRLRTTKQRIYQIDWY
ncbi:helveticin J family class III bacteriocin [Lactobacillus sp. ESL0684]|uniref:helveticin J family class III bacteriocin n=1 Tax=Lactobacillus sp. ESL0684 TaxID=2983213 RepID=UPI0023F7394A|nr:helveticin J family class III bacteriocin [Lactobacillus sp. ESL0684]WEV44202.1 helveticin J family class III bacteriocin [Lactobacillus sp. ESL0684]